MHPSITTVEEYLESVPTWQQANMSLFISLIYDVNPAATSSIKWNVPVFMLGKQMLFATAGFKAHTKYNFIHNGALLDDPDKLFNSGFDSKKSRGIDLKEGESIDTGALKELIAEAIEKA